MEKHGIVPDVVDTACSNEVEVSYGANKVEMGNELTPTQVQKPPTHISYPVESGAMYTVIMTDPDAPSRNNPKFREWVHWMVGNIPGGDVHKGETLSEYVGAGPPNGTGLHRYVYLIYKQPGKVSFQWKHLTNRSGEGRGKFKAKKFAADHNLGELIACNMFQAQWDNYVPKLYEQLSGK